MARDRSDKELAQAATAAAIASGGSKELTEALIEGDMTREEVGRAMAYVASGKKVTGPAR